MFDNKYFIGVTSTGYFINIPIHGPLTDDEAVEAAALIVAMKPSNRKKFDEALARMTGGA